MPVTSSFARRFTYRVYGANGEPLGSEELGSDEEALMWVRKLAKDGVAVARLSRDVAAGFGIDVPLG